jgi:S1-C subfamily serine protease
VTLSPRPSTPRKAALAAVLLAAVVPAAVALAGRSSAPIGTGVVDVKVDLAYGGGSAAATGIVLTSSGEVLTNNHVVRGSSTIRVVVPGTGRSYAAKVLGYNVTADVALLKLRNASNLKTVRLGNSSNLRVGAAVTALGNAGGTGRIVSTTGKIVALGRSIDVGDEQGSAEHLTGLIQTDASLEPGDSGGPLLNGAGRVIGMDTAASARFVFERTSEGYAVPINRAMGIVRQIEAGRSSATVHIGGTAFLGVRVAAADSYPGESGGDIVVSVVPGSPAARAGIAPGDVITAFGGRTVSSPQALSALVLRRSPGAKVRVRWIDRYGTARTATVTLASGPPQ